jgi:hypothetical protein
MLKAKDPMYLKRTSEMIINWQRERYSDDIIHIHGDSDHTIPVKNVNCDHLIKNGSHMMILTRGEEVNTLLLEILNDK